MINLLPPERAAAIRYGRQNTRLIGWLAGAVIAIVGMALICLVGWVYINQEAGNLQRQINNTNQQLQAQNLSKVQADAKEITNDINVIDKVFSKEINFSELVQAIGSYMPPGSVLSGLSLSDNVSGSLDLSAAAKDYTSAAQIAVNLSDPRDDLFSKVDILNINCATSSNKAYPCTVSLRALFSKDAQTKYLSVPAETKP